MDKLRMLYNRLAEHRTWGQYFVNRYYFEIHTNRTKAELGIDLANGIGPEVQLLLQRENYTAIFHEFLHYLHEVSTVIGNVGLGLELMKKSIFSKYFDIDLNSSEFRPNFTPDDIDLLSKIVQTEDMFMGDMSEPFNNSRFVMIGGFEYNKSDIFVPYGLGLMPISLNSPLINCFLTKNGVANERKIRFNKFYLLEGLAYELDREIEKKERNAEEIIETLPDSEYTLMRNLAHYIAPGITKVTMLRLATMALQHINCGHTFILMLENIVENRKNGIADDDTVSAIKAGVRELMVTKQNDFEEAQDEILKVFEKRTQLYSAFRYLTERAKKLYANRIHNLTFEVDLVFEGDWRELIEAAEMCDYMYLFTDVDEFERDFLGTTLAHDTSVALKALLSYDHYFQSHQISSTLKVESEAGHCCPFYYTCNLNLRRKFSSLCNNKPWRLFEVSAKTDKQFCWYGVGVGEFNSHTEN